MSDSLQDQVEPALEARDIEKSFGGVAALIGVNLLVRKGEILGLAGANGAGKSTLINILTGQLHPDSGELLIDGNARPLTSPRQAQELGIGVVRQELDLVPDLTIAENLFLGEERQFKRGLFLDRGAMNAAAQTLLSRVGLSNDPAATLRDLSIGDRQLVAAARALRNAGSILLLDEPTSSLTPFEAARLFTVMRSLRESGLGVVFISHRLNEVAELCDRVVVLRDGRVAGEFRPQEGMDAVVEAMVPGAQALTRQERSGTIGGPVLDVRAVCIGHRPPLDLTLHSGEVVGVFGLVGAGKSSMGKTIGGIIPAADGTMTLEGRQYRPRGASDGFARGVAYLSEDRRGEGILPALTVRDNIVVRTPRDTARAGVLRDAPIGALVREMFSRLNIKAASDRLDIRDLSGGNQQKVLLARLLAEDLKVLVLDEPTHGIDIRAKHDLLETVSHLTDRGITVLMISSEIPELLAASDRILVMRNGEIVLDTLASLATEQSLMSAATGGTR